MEDMEYHLKMANQRFVKLILQEDVRRVLVTTGWPSCCNENPDVSCRIPTKVPFSKAGDNRRMGGAIKPEGNVPQPNLGNFMFGQVSGFGSSSSILWILLIVVIASLGFIMFQKHKTSRLTIPQRLAQFGRDIKSIRRM